MKERRRRRELSLDCVLLSFVRQSSRLGFGKASTKMVYREEVKVRKGYGN